MLFSTFSIYEELILKRKTASTGRVRLPTNLVSSRLLDGFHVMLTQRTPWYVPNVVFVTASTVLHFRRWLVTQTLQVKLPRKQLQGGEPRPQGSPTRETHPPTPQNSGEASPRPNSPKARELILQRPERKRNRRAPSRKQLLQLSAVFDHYRR